MDASYINRLLLCEFYVSNAQLSYRLKGPIFSNSYFSMLYTIMQVLYVLFAGQIFYISHNSCRNLAEFSTILVSNFMAKDVQVWVLIFPDTAHCF